MHHNRDSETPVKVVIVDDTRSIRALIRTMLEASPKIAVVGEASDPFEARELIRHLNPDVITLDVQMPRMDGLSFLKRLMALRPMPVVMVSAHTTEKSWEAIKALSLGAVDCVDLAQLKDNPTGDTLAQTVLMAAGSNLLGMSRRSAQAVTSNHLSPSFEWNGKIVVIGSSTGGVDALLHILSAMPEDCPPILVAQHMPPSFLESFARRLERNCMPRVQLTEDGAALQQGVAYLAAGGETHAVLSTNDPYTIQHSQQDGTEAFVPSVNQLFSSAVKHAKRSVGVMLTGMGNDGAAALLKMKEAGAHTIVQDSASAVVDGMPRSARELGAAK